MNSLLSTNLKVIADDMLPVYETSSGEKVVDARELHEKLLVGKDFTNWIKDRIDKYGFIDGEDFNFTLAKIGERSNVIRHDYWLSLDCAKEIAMVQNNEMGRAIRKYFIEVEKKFKQMIIASYMIDDPIKRAEKWIDEQKQRQQLEVKTLMLEQQVAEAKPKVTYFDEILKSKNLVTITQIAKDYGMSGQALNDLLHREGIQYKQSGQWLLYFKYQDKGYTKSETQDYKKSNGERGTKLHTKWTQKGRLFINEILGKKGIIPIMDRESEVS